MTIEQQNKRWELLKIVAQQAEYDLLQNICITIRDLRSLNVAIAKHAVIEAEQAGQRFQADMDNIDFNKI